VPMERVETVQSRAAATVAAALFAAGVALALVGPSTFFRRVPPFVLVPLTAMGLVHRFGRTATILIGVSLVTAVVLGGGSVAVASLASLAALGVLLGIGAREGRRPAATCSVASLPVSGWLIAELYTGGAETVGNLLQKQGGEVTARIGDTLGAVFPAFPLEGNQALVATLPALFLSFSVVWALGLYRVGEVLLRRLGQRVPRTTSFTRLSLPLYFSWVMIAGLVLSLWGPGPAAVVGVNAVLAAGVAFSLQGASVLSYWLGRVTGPAVRTIVVLGVWSLGAHLLAVLGFVDTWYDLRRLRGPRDKSGRAG